jgi:hypothetical protein
MNNLQKIFGVILLLSLFIFPVYANDENSEEQMQINDENSEEQMPEYELPGFDETQEPQLQVTFNLDLENINFDNQEHYSFSVSPKGDYQIIGFKYSFFDQSGNSFGSIVINGFPTTKIVIGDLNFYDFEDGTITAKLTIITSGIDGEQTTKITKEITKKIKVPIEIKANDISLENYENYLFKVKTEKIYTITGLNYTLKDHKHNLISEELDINETSSEITINNTNLSEFLDGEVTISVEVQIKNLYDEIKTVYLEKTITKDTSPIITVEAEDVTLENHGAYSFLIKAKRTYLITGLKHRIEDTEGELIAAATYLEDPISEIKPGHDLSDFADGTITITLEVKVLTPDGEILTIDIVREINKDTSPPIIITADHISLANHEGYSFNIKSKGRMQILGVKYVITDSNNQIWPAAYLVDDPIYEMDTASHNLSHFVDGPVTIRLEIIIRIGGMLGTTKRIDITKDIIKDTVVPILNLDQENIITNNNILTVTGEIEEFAELDSYIPFNENKLKGKCDILPLEDGETLAHFSCVYDLTEIKDSLDYEIKFFAYDIVGNSTEKQASLIFDRVAPIIVVTPLTTSDKTPILYGTIEDLTLVDLNIIVNDISYTPIVDENGNWSIQLEKLQRNRYYDVEIYAIDQAGNITSRTDLEMIHITNSGNGGGNGNNKGNDNGNNNDNDNGNDNGNGPNLNFLPLSAPAPEAITEQATPNAVSAPEINDLIIEDQPKISGTTGLLSMPEKASKSIAIIIGALLVVGTLVYFILFN